VASNPAAPRATVPFLRQAVVVSGHMIDHPDRPTPRFPASAESAVTDAIAAVLARWGVGPGALLVSGGARGADIIAAEQALSLGAEVWLLIALPDEEFVPLSVELEGTDWHDRYAALRRRCPTRFQRDELGAAPSAEEAFERNNDWMLDVAQSAAPRLRALAVWDGARGDGPGGTWDFVQRARTMGALVAVVDPMRGTVTDGD
jgi:hypothetical protein